MQLAHAFDRQANNVNAVRLLAALMMSVSQAFYISLGTPDAEPLLSTTGMTLWKHAFIVFFGLSGFLLMASWERAPGTSRYVLSRFLRLMPGLVAAALVTVVLGAWATDLPISQYADPAALGRYVLRVVSMDGQAALPGVFNAPAPENHVLTTLWTMKFLVAGYLGLWLLGATGLHRLAIAHLAAVVALVGLDAALNAEQPVMLAHAAISHGVRFALCFVLGMAAWRFRGHIPMDGKIFSAAMLVIITGCLFGHVPKLAFYVLEIYAALWLSFAIRVPAGGFATDLSYGMYLYAWPATMTWHMQFPDMSIAALALAGTLSGAIMAFVSWRLVERPAIEMAPALEARLRRWLPRLA
jgi:peptidoglycan/LPS O-acetylase OafA/YrhL